MAGSEALIRLDFLHDCHLLPPLRPAAQKGEEEEEGIRQIKLKLEAEEEDQEVKHTDLMGSASQFNPLCRAEWLGGGV